MVEVDERDGDSAAANAKYPANASVGPRRNHSATASAPVRSSTAG